MRPAAIYVRAGTLARTRNGSEAPFGGSWPSSMAGLSMTVYCDRGSGATDDRPRLKALMEDARRGESQVVLAWRFDRSLEALKLLNFVLSNCRWKGGQLEADYRQPFDLIASAALADRQLNSGGSAENGNFGNWRRKRDSNPR